MEFPYDPAIPLLSIYPEKYNKKINLKGYRHLCVTAALFIIAKIGKQLMSINRWLEKDMVYTYMQWEITH